MFFRNAALDSARVGVLVSGEIVLAEPAAEGGLRMYCVDRGWASVATDDGSPLLLPLSRALMKCMPVFGRVYSADVRMPIRNSPAVSSSALGAAAAILPGECVRIERVVLNELAVPKVAIIHDGTTWGWVSFWSVSDASPLFTVEEEDPDPRRVWGSSGDGNTLLIPPECRPKPAMILDGSGGPTTVDEKGRVMFAYRPPTTTTTAACSLFAVGKSRYREELRARHAVEASALALQRSLSGDEPDESTVLNNLSFTRRGGHETAGGERRQEWKEQSFISKMHRSTELVDDMEQPCTVGLVRGHVGMDSLSYIRQTFAGVTVGDAGEEGAEDFFQIDGEGEEDELGEQSVGLERTIGGSGYDSANSIVHLPEHWLHIEDNSEARHADNWATVGFDDTASADLTADELGDEREVEHSPAVHRSVSSARPPPPRVPPPPPPPPEGSAWNLAGTFGSDVETFLEPLDLRLPQLRRACQIARVDNEKLAELEGLRRHWCLDECDTEVREAGDHPFLRWLQRLGVQGIDDTLTVCGSMRKVYEERWDAQAAEDRLMAEEAEDLRKFGLR